MQPVHENGLLLALNAAEGRLQLLLAEEANLPYGSDEAAPHPLPRLLCFQEWDAPSQGAELLTPALASALERLHKAPTAIHRIACVQGPGSFTGLRLVLATAAGLARGTGALQAGLDYLELLAVSAMHVLPACLLREDTTLWVTTHARRQLVHIRGFAPVQGPDAPFTQALTDTVVCPPTEAVDLIQAHTPTGSLPIILGSGLRRNRAVFDAAFAGDTAVLLGDTYDHPSSHALLTLSHRLEFGTEDVPPLYVRPSDAEENLAHIASSLGLDPEAAQAKARRLRGEE